MLLQKFEKWLDYQSLLHFFIHPTSESSQIKNTIKWYFGLIDWWGKVQIFKRAFCFKKLIFVVAFKTVFGRRNISTLVNIKICSNLKKPCTLQSVCHRELALSKMLVNINSRNHNEARPIYSSRKYPFITVLKLANNLLVKSAVGNGLICINKS